MSPSHPVTGRQPWTFLTNHAHVLLCIARSPTILIRDLATQVGITERGVQRIIADLQESGYLTTERQGRRNRYAVRTGLTMRHRLERGHPVASLLDLLRDPPARAGPRSPAPPRRLPPKGGQGKRPAADRGESINDQYVRSNFE